MDEATKQKIDKFFTGDDIDTSVFVPLVGYNRYFIAPIDNDARATMTEVLMNEDKVLDYHLEQLKQVPGRVGYATEHGRMIGLILPYKKHIEGYKLVKKCDDKKYKNCAVYAPDGSTDESLKILKALAVVNGDDLLTRQPAIAYANTIGLSYTMFIAREDSLMRGGFFMRTKAGTNEVGYIIYSIPVSAETGIAGVSAIAPDATPIGLKVGRLIEISGSAFCAVALNEKTVEDVLSERKYKNVWIGDVARFRTTFEQQFPTTAEHSLEQLGYITEEIDELKSEMAKSEGKPSEGVLDAICDSIYTLVGLALCHGYDLDGAFREVQRSNMSKLGRDGKPIFRPSDHKIMKGEDFTPPALAPFMPKCD